MSKTRHFVLLGVAGCGKTTISSQLADRFGGTYLEGDQFHPQSNIDKMASGIPLTDEDRWPWLKRIAADMERSEGTVFVACSSLKKSYRNFLQTHVTEPILFAHLAGSMDLITERLNARKDHFMPAGLLQSQFDTLEVPDHTENAITIDIRPEVAVIVDRLTERLKSDYGLSAEGEA